MSKETEQEVIEVNLTDEMRAYLATRLRENLGGLSRGQRRSVPQYKFLKSVMEKFEASDVPMLYSARELSTLSGWINADIPSIKTRPLYNLAMETQKIVACALDQWLEEN